MTTHQIELDIETENLLQNLIQQTSLSINELVIQGLLVLKNNVVLTTQKPEPVIFTTQKPNFFDVYSQLNIGTENNCAYSSAYAKQGVKAILQEKSTQGKI